MTQYILFYFLLLFLGINTCNAQELIGKYVFTNNVLDSSSKNNHGTAYNVTFTKDRFGNENSALLLNGTNFVSITNILRNDFSIGFWIKTTQWGADVENSHFYGATGIIDNENISTNNDFGINIAKDKITFGTDTHILLSKSSVNTDSWIHVLAIRNTQKQKLMLYINGEKEVEITDISANSIINFQPTIFFGRLHANIEDTAPFYKGALDDIYIYNYEISSNEIAKLYDYDDKKTTKEKSELINKSETIILNIQFKQGSFNLLKESFSELDKLYEWMLKYPFSEVELSGHTSNEGSNMANNTLSFNRAEACKAYLSKKNISAKRIYTKGYGSSKPLFPNTSKINKEKNRRVELLILKKS